MFLYNEIYTKILLFKLIFYTKVKYFYLLKSLLSIEITARFLYVCFNIMFNFINYIGKRGRLIDGSVITTKWFCLFIPLFPLASFRFWTDGAETNILYQRKLFVKSLSVEIPLDWINIAFIYSVYLFLFAFASYILKNNTLVLIFSVAFIGVYSLHVFLKYWEKKLFEIDKSETYQCSKCKAKFNILKLNIVHGYFQCPKCKTLNLL